MYKRQRLDREGVHIKADDGREFFFPREIMQALTWVFGQRFDIPNHQGIYRFWPAHPEKLMQFAHLVELNFQEAMHKGGNGETV